jgi:hypothetical protein
LLSAMVVMGYIVSVKGSRHVTCHVSTRTIAIMKSNVGDSAVRKLRYATATFRGRAG